VAAGREAGRRLFNFQDSSAAPLCRFRGNQAAKNL
jgi:hypothetical protein